MPAQRRDLGILIVGAGFAGIGLAIRLRQAGFDTVTIIDKGQRIGGTWPDNAYPGCTGDTPALQYCFSFEPKIDWHSTWATRAEIRHYLEHCVQKYDLLPQLRLGVEATHATYDPARCRWLLRGAGGEQFSATLLLCCTGALQRPYIPSLPGHDAFAGEQLHSSRWNPDIDWRSHRVAVIGSGASAIQLVPKLVTAGVDRLTLFQRRARRIVPRLPASRPPPTTAATVRVQRWVSWWDHELQHSLQRYVPGYGARCTRRAIAHLLDSIADPGLARGLQPRRRLGGGAVLQSSEFYPAMNRANVALETAPPQCLTRNGIRTRDGRQIDVDTIVYATGFERGGPLPLHVEGPAGRTLDCAWGDGAGTYLGMAIGGFPNLFMTFGPNSNVSHSSPLFTLECQIRYIVRCIEAIAARNLDALEVEPAAAARFQRRLTAALNRSLPRDMNCIERQRRLATDWPGTALSYWWRTRGVDWSAFHQIHADGAPDAHIAAGAAHAGHVE